MCWCHCSWLLEGTIWPHMESDEIPHSEVYAYVCSNVYQQGRFGMFSKCTYLTGQEWLEI